MIIKRLTIEGLRGFSEETDISFAMPDNETDGSGLTVLVGSNNSGKSTIIEAIHLLISNIDTVPLSSRSIKTNGKIKIEVEDESGSTRTIKSTDMNGAFVQKKYNNDVVESWADNMNVLILSSKRGFSSTFPNNNYQGRENYIGNVSGSEYRSENNINYNFGGRLLTICKDKSKFDQCLEKVLDPIPNWAIESYNGNNLCLEFSFGEVKHSSNGSGDGYINIFNIVDALYDSMENNVILIDEPEISLHPDLQRKLFKLLVEYSKDKQIIISTHSPYFVDWKLFSDKSKIIRLNKKEDTTKLYELTENTKEGIRKILKDYQKPHILSLNANEIFFLNDNVILTEGQDDVLCYRELFKKFNYSSNASFFGWGAGGATNVKYILDILNDLGYDKVFTILDNDQKQMLPSLETEYSKYHFFAIAADDVRNKCIDKKIKSIIKEIKQLPLSQEIQNSIFDIIGTKYKNKTGLVKNMSSYEINPEYEETIHDLINELKEYFASTKDIQKVDIDKKTYKNNSELDNERKAKKLLEKWLSENNLYTFNRTKYKELEFKSGGGSILSFKFLGNAQYYVIIEQTNSISQKHSITVDYHLIVNINKNIVKLKKKQIVSNTLPVSKIRKMIEKIFN